MNNVFDSLHHFGVLVRTYYIQQLDNQRIKLLTSNSLVGNPVALFDAVGTGARDFLSEPGRAKGSVDFFASVGRGSKSLLTHTVGGFVESVCSSPRAFPSGLQPQAPNATTGMQAQSDFSMHLMETGRREQQNKQL